MDRILRPERFSTEPSDPESEKRYKHWKKTFENYLATALTAAAEDNVAAVAANELKKLHALQNTVTLYLNSLLIPLIMLVPC